MDVQNDDGMLILKQVQNDGGMLILKRVQNDNGLSMGLKLFKKQQKTVRISDRFRNSLSIKDLGFQLQF